MQCSFDPLVRWGLRLVAFALLTGTAAAREGGGDLPSTVAPANAQPINYCPAERLAFGAAAPEQYLNVFLPAGSPPAAGWPVVVTTGFGGGIATPPSSTITEVGPTGPLHDLLEAGIAIVHYGATGVSGGAGLWYPAGHPSGKYESFQPQHDNPEKEAEWTVQWVKIQSQFDLDVDNIGMRGSSGGAVLAVRTAMGPDRARATGSDQIRASTRIKALLVLQPPTSAWAMVQGPELEISLPDHLERKNSPGSPATALSEVDAELQKDYSIMRFAFDTQEALDNNAQQRICLVYGDPVYKENGVPNFSLDATGYPILHDVVIQPTQHDGWFGYMFWKRLMDISPESAAFHAEHSLFAMRDIFALAAPNDLHTQTYSGTFKGAAATQIGHDWLVAQLCEPAVPSVDFTPYGCGGNPAASLSVVSGSPVLGSTVVFAVDNPLGTQAIGSAALLGISTIPAAGFPCGPMLNGFGMDGGPGELLVGLGSTLLRPLPQGAPWSGAGQPSEVSFAIPDDPILLGFTLYVQGVIFDPTAQSGNKFGLAEALHMTLRN